MIDPIEMPAVNAPPEAWVAFLSHQLMAMAQHVNAQTETGKQISERVTAVADQHIDAMKRALDDKLHRVMTDYTRYQVLRGATVKSRKYSISAKGVELDWALDKIILQSKTKGVQ